MGARGPLPKDPAMRKRKNRPPETEKLQTQSEAAKNKIPAMPERAGKKKWDPMVRRWWETIWKSPMAAKWLPSDVAGILPHLCMLHQFAAEAKTPNGLLSVMSAIKQQEARLGLSPSDRQRLRWEVPDEEPTAEEAAARRPWEEDDAEPEPGAPAVKDPRSALTTIPGGLDQRGRKRA